MYYRLIAQLHQRKVALLLLGGNHDSVSVLSESLPLLHHLNTTVIAATGDAAQHVITLPVRGSTQPGCIVCALPFIRPRDVLTSQAGQSAEDKQRNLQSAIQDTYAQVFAAAQALQAQLQAAHGTRVPIVATGHLTTVGASSNESVREIYVGALEAFPTSAFPPADYIALGHIHKPQKVGGLEHIRYCGSPIALGFDEAKQTKEVLLVDLNAHGLQALTPLATPVCQILASLTGNLASLPVQLQALAAQSSADHPALLEVTVQEDDYLPDVAARIDAMAQGLPLQVLRVKRQRGTAMPQLLPSMVNLWRPSPQRRVCAQIGPRRCLPMSTKLCTSATKRCWPACTQEMPHENSEPAPEESERPQRRMDDRFSPATFPR
nr:exonuclease SbcCD subunit D C-terminal domain-containing protein [Comamonas jiangduensis]